ncbi:YjzD family protein [Bacillus norwichensis]|nr:YjzD family protein [Bacillus norwichensis]
MRFIMMIFWTLLLVNMLMYVAGSMIGSSYDFGTATTLGVFAVILIFIISALIPAQPTEEQ